MDDEIVYQSSDFTESSARNRQELCAAMCNRPFCHVQETTRPVASTTSSWVGTTDLSNPLSLSATKLLNPLFGSTQISTSQKSTCALGDAASDDVKSRNEAVSLCLSNDSQKQNELAADSTSEEDEADYLNKRLLHSDSSIRVTDLVAYIITMSIPGIFSGWNNSRESPIYFAAGLCLAAPTFIGIAMTTSELVSSLPFAGGPVVYARCAFRVQFWGALSMLFHVLSLLLNCAFLVICTARAVPDEILLHAGRENYLLLPHLIGLLLVCMQFGTTVLYLYRPRYFMRACIVFAVLTVSKIIGYCLLVYYCKNENAVIQEPSWLTAITAQAETSKDKPMASTTLKPIEVSAVSQRHGGICARGVEWEYRFPGGSGMPQLNTSSVLPALPLSGYKNLFSDISGSAFFSIVQTFTNSCWMFLSLPNSGTLAEEMPKLVQSGPSATMIVCWVLCTCAFALVGSMPNNLIAFSSQPLPIIWHASLIMGVNVNLYFWVFVSIVIIVPMYSGALAAATHAASRHIYAMSRAGFLPTWISCTTKSGVPQYAVLCVLIMVASIVATVISSIYALKYFGVANVSTLQVSNVLVGVAVQAKLLALLIDTLAYIVLQFSQRALPRPYVSPLRLVGAFAIVVQISVMGIVAPYIANPYRALVILSGIAGAAIIFVIYYFTLARSRIKLEKDKLFIRSQIPHISQVHKRIFLDGRSSLS